ncbi:hypothetical protein MY3957_006161 [Beauveria namnaoensis]
MDFLSNDLLWDDFNLSTPQLPNNDSQRSGQEASPQSDVERSPEPEPDQSQIIGRLPLLRSCDFDFGRDYDRNNPTCIHYDLKLKILQRGAGKKRSMQVDLLQRTNVVLAPSDLWRDELEAHVATLRSDPDKFPAGSDNYTSRGGTVSIKARSTRSGFNESFGGEDIPWLTVDGHLESLGGLFKMRRMAITLAIDLTFHEAATTAAAGKKQRKSATSVARSKLPSDAVFMTRFYKRHECDAKSCRQNSMYCLKDKNGNHHAIDREKMRASYAEVKARVKEGEGFEDVEDIEIPLHFRREILSESRKRKANGDIGCRNCKTRGVAGAERLEVSGDPDDLLEEYCTKNLNMQSDRRRDGMEAANRFAMEALLDLATIHQKQDTVTEKMVASGVPLGSALLFVSGIASFIASREMNGEE